MAGGAGFREKIVYTIKKYNMISSGDGIVLGLSGGADSSALFHLLLSLCQEMEFRLCAVHVNHLLRGEAAFADEQFCQTLCETHHVAFWTFREDVNAYAAQHGMSGEEAGREIRYAAFREGLKRFDCNKIAVAHTKNDWGETLLMRFFRGTGLNGLGGIPPVRGDVIRPLIEAARTEIEAFLRENALLWATDATNAENSFTRNKIRNVLIPYIEKEINPGFMEAVTRSSILFREDEEYLSSAARDAYAGAKSSQGLSIALLKGLHPAISARVIRLAVEDAFGLKDIHACHMDGIVNLLNNTSGKSIDIGKGGTARICYGQLIFEKPVWHNCSFFTLLVMDDLVYIDQIKRWVSASFNKIDESSSMKQEGLRNVYTIALDYDKIKGDVVIRTRQPGDRIFFSSVGTKKLKDYLIDKKVPREKRAALYCLAQGNEILWLSDGTVSSRYDGKNSKNQLLYVQFWEDNREDGNERESNAFD